MIRLLLDMGLPRRTAEDLRTQGIDVEHVAQRGLATAADETIIALAVEERRIVVTEDHDFARIIARTQGRSPSLVFLRIPGLARNQATSLLARVIDVARGDLEVGAVVTVSQKGIRVRRLPLR